MFRAITNRLLRIYIDILFSGRVACTGGQYAPRPTSIQAVNAVWLGVTLPPTGTFSIPLEWLEGEGTSDIRVNHRLGLT